ncbi:MAG: phasin family protein [Bdellovibrionales bacterium]|jgi:hypothetical protein
MQATNEQMEKMTSTLLQAASDMNTMVRDTMNVTLQSVSIMTKGCGELCDSLSALVQKNIDQSSKVTQSLSSITSVDDLVSTQNTALKDNFDSMMSDLNNLSQISSRVAQQAAEPVTKHVNDSINKISKIKAA